MTEDVTNFAPFKPQCGNHLSTSEFMDAINRGEGQSLLGKTAIFDHGVIVSRDDGHELGGEKAIHSFFKRISRELKRAHL